MVFREGWEGKEPNMKRLVFALCDRWTVLALSEVGVPGNADLGCLWALQVEMPGRQMYLQVWSSEERPELETKT